MRHWGWDGRGGATLETTGREFGRITRERVRQLCERLADKLSGPAPATPALDSALVLAAHAAPTTAHDLARRLADERVSTRPFDPAGLLTAAAVLGREPTFTLETVKDVRVVLPDPPDPASDTMAVIAAVVDTARAIVRRAGAARVGEVTGRVAADLAVWVEDDLVTAVVSEPDDFAWLERRTGWFYLPSVAKNAVASRVAKVLSVAGAARLPDLHAGIRRDERMREFIMPEYILGELCERLPGVRLEGDVAVADPRRALEDVLERTELTLFQALVRTPEGRRTAATSSPACLAAGMKASSFNNRIAYSPHRRRPRARSVRPAGREQRRRAPGMNETWRPAPTSAGSPADPSRAPAISRNRARRRGAARTRRCSTGASPPSRARSSSSSCSSGSTASGRRSSGRAPWRRFLVVLWAATIPLRARQRRVWREMGLGPDGRPLPKDEEVEPDQEDETDG